MAHRGVCPKWAMEKVGILIAKAEKENPQYSKRQICKDVAKEMGISWKCVWNWVQPGTGSRKPKVPADIKKFDIFVKENEWWALGDHSLFCGDTSLSSEFEKSCEASAFVFADPPYNADAAEWDNNFNWQHDYLIEKAPIVAITPGIISIFDFARITNMPYRWSMACWITNGMTRGALGYGNWVYVSIFSTLKSLDHNTQDFFKTTIKTSKTKQTTHKGRKPIEIVTRLIKLFSEKGQVVIDPFLGSGTTLWVAEALGRRCIAGEIDPAFCSEVILRWQELTNKEAKKLNG